MQVNGIVAYTISKSGSLVDFRFDFLVEQSNQDLALYWFDSNSSATDQAFADAAVRARVQGKKPKMKIDVLGERAPNAASLHGTVQLFNQFASGKGDKATAKVSKLTSNGGSDAFTINLEIPGKKNTLKFGVPFEGDPDVLAEKTFQGKVTLLTHSKEKDADIPEAINLILAIKP